MIHLIRVYGICHFRQHPACERPGSEPGLSDIRVVSRLAAGSYLPLHSSSDSGSILSVKTEIHFDNPQIMPNSTTVIAIQKTYPNNSFVMISTSPAYLSTKLSTTGKANTATKNNTEIICIFHTSHFFLIVLAVFHMEAPYEGDDGKDSHYHNQSIGNHTAPFPCSINTCAYVTYQSRKTSYVCRTSCVISICQK